MFLQIASIFNLKPRPAPDALPPLRAVPHFFAVQKLCFNFLGIDPTSERKTLFNPLLLWIPMAFMVPLLVSMLICGIESRDNLELVTDILAPFWQYSLIFVKMLNFLWNRKKMVKLVRNLWLWSLEATEDELEIIAVENRAVHFSSVLFFKIVSITGILAFVKPFVFAYIGYLKENGFRESLGLPLKSAYHLVLDPQTLSGYICAYLWNVVAVSHLFFAVIGNDTLFTWFSYNVSAQFRIVNHRFQNSANDEYLRRDENLFIKSIADNIKFHQRAIELAENFNEIFMVTLFFMYAITFIQIAFVIFLISGTNQWGVVIYNISFFTTVSLQLLMYCWGGQRIINQSSSTAEVISDQFRWHAISIKSKKMLLLSLMRAQKPCILKGFFFVAGMPSFLTVYKTAGSLLTMLKSVE